MKQIPLIGLLFLLAVSGAVQAQPPGAPQNLGFGQASPPSQFSVQRGMRFERYRDRNGYQLRIHTRGMDPESIQVSVQGRSLVVQNREAHQVERRSDRGSYRFAASSSNMRRRFRLPPDADVSAMERRVEEDVLVITLPYAQGYKF